MDENRQDLKNQNISLKNRNRMSITGVENVDSYNDNTIVLQTIKGGISIEGEELNISKLNIEDGSLRISGLINSLTYISKEGAPKNIIERLFR